MRIVSKTAPFGPEPVDLSAEQRDTLRRWYVGKGDHQDEAECVEIVRLARQRASWIECDCLPASEAQACLTPALLAMADTYYLRRLDGPQRAHHVPDCPFFRDQVIAARTKTAAQIAASKRPAGHFAILEPSPDHLAKGAPPTLKPAASKPAIPRMARLLWNLLELANLHTINSAHEAERLTIKHGFHAIRDAVRPLTIAPKRLLADFLFLHPAAVHDGTLQRRLEVMGKDWPQGHEPQAFLAVYTRQIDKQVLRFGDTDAIEVIGTVQQPSVGDRQVRGPFLTLVAFGYDADTREFGALRAYAQPVLSGRSLFPVASPFERTTLEQLLDVQRDLAAEGVNLGIRKPLFDLSVEGERCRPDLLLLAQGDHLQAMPLCVDLVGFGSPERDEAMAALRPTAERLGRVITVTPEDLQRRRIGQIIRECVAVGRDARGMTVANHDA